MRFNYQYRTRDNEVRCGVISAPDREAVFRVLKEQGIRPSRVDEAPGLVNKLFGRGKRWMAIGVLLGLVAMFAVLFERTSETLETIQTTRQFSTRHQIYGEPAFMDELSRTEYATVFALKGERYLAKFAQPGVMPTRLDQDWKQDCADALPHVLTNEVAILDSDRREVVELKQIVNGMKAELKRYLSNGVGSCATYVTRMVQRQSEEYQIYLRAQNRLTVSNGQEDIEKINDSLRAIGLPTLVAHGETAENEAEKENEKK